MEYAEGWQEREVPDPYYGGAEGFDAFRFHMDVDVNNEERHGKIILSWNAG